MGCLWQNSNQSISMVYLDMRMVTAEFVPKLFQKSVETFVSKDQNKSWLKEISLKQ